MSRLSFAEPDAMARLLDTTPGSVSALELLFDREGKVRLVIDRELLEDTCISGHPGISTSTLRLDREDMLAYLASTRPYAGLCHPAAPGWWSDREGAICRRECASSIWSRGCHR